jgi:hypothetical protein
MTNPPNSLDIRTCGGLASTVLSECTWGSPAAPKTIALVGDSTALAYTEAFKTIVEQSSGQWKLQLLAVTGCPSMAGKL